MAARGRSATDANRPKGHTHHRRESRSIPNVAEGVTRFRVVPFFLHYDRAKRASAAASIALKARMTADEIEIRIGLRRVHGFDTQFFECQAEQIERGVEFLQFDD